MRAQKERCLHPKQDLVSPRKPELLSTLQLRQLLNPRRCEEFLNAFQLSAKIQKPGDTSPEVQPRRKIDQAHRAEQLEISTESDQTVRELQPTAHRVPPEGSRERRRRQSPTGIDHLSTHCG